MYFNLMELNFRLIPFSWLLVSFQRSTNLWSEWNHFVVSVKICIVLFTQIINYEINSQDIITYTGKLIMYKQENTPVSACSVAFVIQKLVKFVIRKNPLFSLYEILCLFLDFSKSSAIKFIHKIVSQANNISTQNTLQAF